MKCLFLCSIVSLGVACSKDTVVDQRTITLYTFALDGNRPTCTAPGDSYASYYAAGDFEPDPSAPPQAYTTLDTISPSLDGLPSTTKQLYVDVTHADDGGHWRGFGDVDASSEGDVSILLWPYGHECAFKNTPDMRPGSQMVAYDDHHVLVTGGVSGTPSFVVDLSKGSTAPVIADILAARTNATATAYPSGVVVFGGESGNQVVQTAEFFDARSGSFSATPLPLTFARTHQGATTLANGNVVIVGGESESTGIYSSLEVIDTAAKKELPLGGLATLAQPRKDPVVLTLTSGEVLVAGGTASDGTAIGTIEWFSSDVTQRIETATINASAQEAFVGLPAGGALAVVAQSSGADVWLIHPDHTVEQAPSITGLPSNAPVKLFSGADGSPMLWTGADWLRWSPWTGAFVLFTETESVSGSSAGGPPDDATSALIASPDPGLALWLDDSGFVTGLRFDARGAYSTDVDTLLAIDTTHIAPDRLPGSLPGSSLSFDTAQGPGTGLSLGIGAQVVVADANYGDFSLDLDTGKEETPILFLRDVQTGNDFTIGVDPSVPPKVTCAVSDANHWHVERRSGAVSVSADDAPLSTCATSLISASRLTIGLRGRSASSSVTATARNLVIKRD